MKIIACYSNKGGVGKTAAAVNLAYACAVRTKKRTLLCDLDPQGASSFYFRLKASKKLNEKVFFKDTERLVKAIRESDFANLDLLPADMTFRDFDIFLAQMRRSRSRLKKTLASLSRNYDTIFLDCPPNISRLSENVFRVSDKIIIPVIPTTLSELTFIQLLNFFKEHRFNRKKIMPFFSMVEMRKKLHSETIARLRKRYKGFLEPKIPFSSDVEKMGIHRAPVLTYAKNCTAAKRYWSIWREIEKSIKR